MRLRLVAAPVGEPINLDEAKSFLKVDSADENALITALIKAARERVERWILRALMTQTWELTLDEAKAEIRLPRPPLREVMKIEVIDDAGAKSEVPSSTYWVDITQNSPARIRLRQGCTWPGHRGFASFIVTFKAGYGDNADDVPQPIREAIKQIVADMFENRGDVKAAEDLPALAVTLLQPYRILYI